MKAEFLKIGDGVGKWHNIIPIAVVENDVVFADFSQKLGELTG